MSSLDHIDVGGMSFVKASSLAKQFKYTQDYIGQLCRAKKVNARLVGRTWYVDPTSLQAHKDGRYAELRSGKVKSVTPEHTEPVKRLKIEPRQDKRHLKQEKDREAPTLSKNFYDRLDARTPSYFKDSSELIPLVNRQDVVKEDVSVALPVEQAGAVEIPIQGSDAHLTRLRSEALPSVVLKGKLNIEDVPENIEEIVDEETHDTFEKMIISDRGDKESDETLDKRRRKMEIASEEEVTEKKRKLSIAKEQRAPKPAHLKIVLTEKLDSEKKAVKTENKVVVSEDESKSEEQIRAKTTLDEPTKEEKAIKQDTSNDFDVNEFVFRVRSAPKKAEIKSATQSTPLKITKIVPETPSTISLFKYAPVGAVLGLLAGGVVFAMNTTDPTGDGSLLTAIGSNLASLYDIFR